MKSQIALLAVCCVVGFALPLFAEPPKRKSMLDSDPDVVYLEPILKKPITLSVVKEAPVFSDKEGSRRLGFLKVGQTVKLEALGEKAYKARAQGFSDNISGWVAPWAFGAKDPEFAAHLKKFYERQIQVQKLIAARQVAVGMTLDEVAQSRGKPTKTSAKKTAKGETMTLEYIDMEEQKNYVTRVDPVTGQVFRQLLNITQVEKGHTTVEFENGLVTSIEEKEDHEGGNVRIVVPPVIFGW